MILYTAWNIIHRSAENRQKAGGGGVSHAGDWSALISPKGPVRCWKLGAKRRHSGSFLSGKEARQLEDRIDCFL